MSQDITQKLWNYCLVLLADGMHFSDYIEKLMYLLFLKMVDEPMRAPYSEIGIMPETVRLAEFIQVRR